MDTPTTEKTLDIVETFRNVSRRMQADFEEARAALSHPGLKGTANERILSTFLKRYLPKSLDICTGVLVDAEGRRTRQLDIIITDAASTPILFEQGDIRVIPIECAYAVIEVKALLDFSGLDSIFENIRSVRQLEKKAFVSLKQSSLPHYRPCLYGKSWDYWPVMYFVFAFDAIDIDRLAREIDHRHEEKQLPLWSRIDMVGILNSGVICNYHKTKTAPLPYPTPETITFIAPTRNALLLFHTLLMNVLCQAWLPPFFFGSYVKYIPPE